MANVAVISDESSLITTRILDLKSEGKELQTGKYIVLQSS